MRTQIWTPAGAGVGNSFVVASDPPAVCLPAHGTAGYRAGLTGNAAWGAWHQVFAGTAYAYELAIYEVYVGQTNVGTQVGWRLGVGASGSEAVVREGFASAASNDPIVGVLDPPLILPASTRLAVSLWDVSGGGGWQFDVETMTLNAYRPPVLMAEGRDMTEQPVDLVPGMATAINLTCLANSWGAWVQCWAGLAYASALTGYHRIDGPDSFNRSLQFGIGAAGSEVALAGIYRNLRRPYNYACTLPVGVRVPANARLAARVYRRGVGDNVNIKLYRTRLPM